MSKYFLEYKTIFISFWPMLISKYNSLLSIGLFKFIVTKNQFWGQSKLFIFASDYTLLSWVDNIIFLNSNIGVT